MSVSADALRLHLDYSAWASARVVGATSQLSSEELNRDFGTADRSVLGTLVHTFAGDRLWFSRVSGGPHPGFITDADRSLAVLQNDWPAIYERWKKWAGQLTDESVLGSVSYKDLKGNPWTTTIWQVVLHVVNHGTHHRGQASGFLRSMGHTPPQLDLIYYYRDLGSAKAQAG